MVRLSAIKVKLELILIDPDLNNLNTSYSADWSFYLMYFCLASLSIHCNRLYHYG